jgi:hypothetical protein
MNEILKNGLDWVEQLGPIGCETITKKTII